MKIITCFIRSSILTLSIFSTASATVLINEIDYDQAGTDIAEFIELFNSGPDNINLANYRLDLINGATTTVYRSFDLTGYSLAADSYFVICANASTVMNCDFDAGISKNMIQNGAPDGLALFNGNDLIDAMTYEGVILDVTEGPNGALADNSAGTLSIGRLPGSQDTNDNAADFEHGCITPGTANVSGSGNCSSAKVGTVPQPPVIWLLASGLIGMLSSAKVRKKSTATTTSHAGD